MVVYTSAEAAATAPQAEGVTIGKENSVQTFIEAGKAAEEATGIATIQAKQADKTDMYNLAGQKVDSGYKGLVIKNGKKMIQK